VFWVQGTGTWQGPLAIGPGDFTHSGAALTTSQQFGIPNQTDVWVVGFTGINVFWVQGTGTWQGPLAIGPGGFATTGSALSSSQQFGISNQTDVFVVGNDGAVYVFWVDGAGSWHGPLGITPTGFAAPGVALTSSQQFGIGNQTDVWEVANDGAIHVSWVEGAGNWKGPLQI
jgi:hypothetical protein